MHTVAKILLLLSCISSCSTYSSDKAQVNMALTNDNNEKSGENTNADSAKEATYRKPSTEELRRKLTPLQYHVTQEQGTERPFKNEYWNNHEHGLYVDIVTGEPLFTSLDKYDSGTGWPSFSKPLSTSRVVEHKDKSYGMVRTEVRSSAGTHLGHVFDDGPPSTGTRYCINSASLRFIPVTQLAKEGYGQYVALFANSGDGKNTMKDAPKATQGDPSKSCANPVKIQNSQ